MSVTTPADGAPPLSWTDGGAAGRGPEVEMEAEQGWAAERIQTSEHETRSCVISRKAAVSVPPVKELWVRPGFISVRGLKRQPPLRKTSTWIPPNSIFFT